MNGLCVCNLAVSVQVLGGSNNLLEMFGSGDSDGMSSIGKTQWRKCCFKSCLLKKSSRKGSFHSFPKGEKNMQRYCVLF